MPNFEQVAFSLQCSIILVLNWLIKLRMPFLDVTSTNVRLNKAGCLAMLLFVWYL